MKVLSTIKGLLKSKTAAIILGLVLTLGAVTDLIISEDSHLKAAFSSLQDTVESLLNDTTEAEAEVETEAETQ